MYCVSCPLCVLLCSILVFCPLCVQFLYFVFFCVQFCHHYSLLLFMQTLHYYAPFTTMHCLFFMLYLSTKTTKKSLQRRPKKSSIYPPTLRNLPAWEPTSKGEHLLFFPQHYKRFPPRANTFYFTTNDSLKRASTFYFALDTTKNSLKRASTFYVSLYTRNYPSALQALQTTASYSYHHP